MFDGVCAHFIDTPQGKDELSYAGNLAKMLNVPLFVHVNNVSSFGDFLDLESLKNCVISLTGLPPSHLRYGFDMHEDFSDMKMIFVGNGFSVDLGREVSHLVPFWEKRLARGDSLKVVIPFGDGESGIRAARIGIPFAKQIGSNILLWHTTWRDAQVSSEDMQLHMCEDAKNVLRTLKGMCRKGSVPFEVRVESADDVSEGIVRAALFEGASLIVMARGNETGRGSYLDQVLGRSSVPILIAREGAVS